MYIRSRFTNEFGQVPNPDNMPTKPIIPDKDPMPTNPVVPKKWCPQLPKIQSNICFSYGPQEIAISKTEAGHLTPDVVLLPQVVMPNPAMPNTVLSCQYLVIRDFGVNWRHVKLSTRNEQLFKDSLTRFETDKSLAFRDGQLPRSARQPARGRHGSPLPAGRNDGHRVAAQKAKGAATKGAAKVNLVTRVESATPHSSR